MRFAGNPLVWLMRIRKRCGYGVHSPFAFRLITEVIYEETPFDAYAKLDSHLPFAFRFRRRKGYRLLFRLANWFQPKIISIMGDCPMERAYFKAGCAKAVLTDTYASRPERNIIFLNKPDDEVIACLHADTMLIVDDIQKHREWFKRLPAVVSFDLYDLGIAFFDTQYHKHYYIVNF